MNDLPPAGRPRGLHWRRFDTLGLRLFVLMWVTLVLSHIVAYSLAMPLTMPGGPGPLERLTSRRVPTLPSLPPHGPLQGMGPPGAPGGPGAEPGPGSRPDPSRGPNGPGPGTDPPGGPHLPALPAATLWLDYGLRMAVIALGAALGARWLARPMQRLSRAAGALSQGLARGQPPPVLNEAQGTAEVREAARVFNGMASRLQEQFDARGMHLASVSHDLRTPLTRLRMRLEGPDNRPPELDALAAAAAADIHEMSEMIDSTLEVLHEQRAGSQARLVDIVALLQALVDDLAVAGQDVELAPAAPSMPLQAMARPAALKRIAGNLVGNALRYGGCARVAVQLQGGGVLVTVDDSGPGIPPDQLEQAFHPWVRLTASHPRAGHGLGLAIARDLARRDGGRLTLANHAAGGLQARLWLPLPAADGTPPAAA